VATVAYVDVSNLGSTSFISPATRAVGDLMIVTSWFAGTGPPGLGTGYVDLGTVQNGTALGGRIAGRFADGTAADNGGTWTGAVATGCAVFRGAGMPVVFASNTGNSNSVGYAALNLRDPGASWVHRTGAHLSSTNMHLGSLTGYTFRLGSNGTAWWDSNGPLFSLATGTQSVNQTNSWGSWSIEIPPITPFSVQAFWAAMQRANLY
jgi:hypothetical protein